MGGSRNQAARLITNPFDLLGVYVDDKKMYFTERATESDKWSYTTDFGKLELPK